MGTKLYPASTGAACLILLDEIQRGGAKRARTKACSCGPGPR
jgi:hypothetical protein